MISPYEKYESFQQKACNDCLSAEREAKIPCKGCGEEKRRKEFINPKKANQVMTQCLSCIFQAVQIVEPCRQRKCVGETTTLELGTVVFKKFNKEHVRREGRAMVKAVLRRIEGWNDMKAEAKQTGQTDEGDSGNLKVTHRQRDRQ